MLRISGLGNLAFCFLKKEDMPHLVVECSENVLTMKSPDEMVGSIYKTATATDGFPNNVMVRIIPFQHYTTIGSKDDFIFICAHILEGRTLEQKQALSKNIIKMLKNMFPEIPKISMIIREFERASFINNSMV